MLTLNIIWLDDERNPHSDNYWPLIDSYISAHSLKLAEEVKAKVIWLKSYDAFVEYLESHNPHAYPIHAIFFDNDLGQGKQGKHAFTWLEEQARLKGWPAVDLFTQSSNSSARLEMERGFQVLQNFWLYEGLHWSLDDNGKWSGEAGALTEAEVIYCEEGQADSSLIHFVRHWVSAQGVDVSKVKPSPKGWYWSATIEARGIWCSPVGPFSRHIEAIENCSEAWYHKTRK